MAIKCGRGYGAFQQPRGGNLASDRVQRRLTAILAADVAGYSRERAVAHREAIWELAGNRLCLALAFLRIGHHRCQSATTRARRDIAFSAYLFVHTRRASARHRDQWPQGNLCGARALRTATFLQALRGTVRQV